MTPPDNQLKNCRFYMVIRFENITQAYGVNSVSEFQYFSEINNDYDCYLLQNPYFINHEKLLRNKLTKQLEKLNVPQAEEKTDSATN